MAIENQESARPRAREDGAQSFMAVAIAFVSVAIIAVEKWIILPALVRYLDRLEAKVDRLKELQADTAAEVDVLLPSSSTRRLRENCNVP